MNIHALFHQAKSEYSYQYDEHTLHILFRTAKNDVNNVTLIYGDPFDWVYEGGKARWNSEMIPMKKTYSSRYFDYFFIEVKPKDYRCKYAFVVKNTEKLVFFGSKRLEFLDHLPENTFDGGSFYDLSNYFNYPYLNKEDLPQTPYWVKDTVWYQIFPDRFYSKKKQSQLPWGKLPVNNHEIYGGDLLGVVDKLPYLKDLGVTGIYFTPIFEAPSAHKYDTKDYFTIDPSFGTNEEFKYLVEKAHKLGIKIVLDGVFNHCGWDHPFFQDVVKFGEKSPYYDCFFIDRKPLINFELSENGRPIMTRGMKPNYRTFAYTPFMPKWNTDHPLTQKHLLSVIEYWIKEYDIDGWRLDVSNEISHDFLRQIKKTARQAKKDSFIFGENWDSSMPWLRGDQMDAVMNYDLTIPLWNYLEHKIDIHEFKDEVSNYLALTPKHIMENMFNLVDTHDTERILRRVQDHVDKVKFAYLFMFLSAGAPNIYYGSEIGLTGNHDPDNRRCMIWDEKNQNLDLKAFIKRLIELRKTHPVMAHYDYHFYDQDSLSMIKKNEKETLLVLINYSDEEKDVKVPRDFEGTVTEILSDSTEILSSVRKVQPYQYFIYKK